MIEGEFPSIVNFLMMFTFFVVIISEARTIFSPRFVGREETYYITTSFANDREYQKFLNTVKDRSRYDFHTTEEFSSIFYFSSHL